MSKQIIERAQGRQPTGRNQSSAYKDLVWTVAAALDEDLDILGQTQQTVDVLDSNLEQLGSDKSKIISAQVFLSDINNKSKMDKVWQEWIGDNPENWPQRACVGVQLGGNWLIEVTVIAVRDN